MRALLILAFSGALHAQILSSIVSTNPIASASAVVTLSTNHAKEAASDGVLDYPSDTTPGSLLIVVWNRDATGTTLSGCTDTQGNTWTLNLTGAGATEGRITNSNPLWGLEVWKAVNIVGGPNRVTCLLSGAALFGSMFVLEYKKNSGSAPNIVSFNGVIENISTVGPVTTTLAAAKLMVASFIGDGSSANCTGYSTVESANGNSVSYIQDATAGAAGSYSASGCGSSAFFSNHAMAAIQ